MPHVPQASPCVLPPSLRPSGICFDRGGRRRIAAPPVVGLILSPPRERRRSPDKNRMCIVAATGRRRPLGRRWRRESLTTPAVSHDDRRRIRNCCGDKSKNRTRYLRWARSVTGPSTVRIRVTTSNDIRWSYSSRCRQNVRLPFVRTARHSLRQRIQMIPHSEWTLLSDPAAAAMASGHESGRCGARRPARTAGWLFDASRLDSGCE